MIDVIRALKSCRFADKNYSARDIVPESAVDTRAIGRLVKSKVIELVENPAPVKPVTPPLKAKPKVKKPLDDK